MSVRDAPGAAPRNRFEAWAGRRWDQRRESLPTQTQQVDVVRAIEVACAPHRLWSLVDPPEYAPLLSTGVVQGFTMPGTPRGSVGERQCFMREDGTGTLRAQIVEITEYDPGHSATVAPVPDNGTRTTTTITGSATRSIIALRFTATVPADLGVSVSQRATAQFDTYLDRVRHHIESGWNPTPDPTAAPRI